MTRPATPNPHLVEIFRGIRRDARMANAGDGTPTAIMAAITWVIDGGGSAITTGNKGGLIVPFPCRIKKVELQEFDGTSGTITLDIQKGTPGTAPTFTSICASTKPTIAVSGRYYMDQAWAPTNGLTGWTTLISRGDALRYVVNAAATIQRITCTLHVQRLDVTG